MYTSNASLPEARLLIVYFKSSWTSSSNASLLGARILSVFFKLNCLSV